MSDIIAYINTPIDAWKFRQLMIGLEGFVVDIDDAENIVIREA